MHNGSCCRCPDRLHFRLLCDGCGAPARTPPTNARPRRFYLPPQPSPAQPAAPHAPRALCLRRAFGAQTWLTRCQPPAGAAGGGCEPDATDAEWITPTTDLTVKGSGFGKQANPFRSNDGLRTADADYLAQLRGRQHQQTPNYYGRGGTQGAADGTDDLNKFNGYGSFTTLDTSFQRATASITALAAEDIDDPTKVATAMATGLTAAERETLGSGANTGGSDVEHGVLRCDVPKDSGGTTATHAWTKTAMTVDGTAFAPPLQGGSARLHRQVADFAEGTVCP